MTFQSAYLNKIANFNLQNTFLKEEKQSQLFQLFAHISLTHNPQATADIVPDKVWANLPPDPKIIKIEEQHTLLKQDKYRIKGYKDEEQI